MSDGYSQEYEKQYKGEEWFEQVLVKARRRRVLESAQRHPSRRVLEIGCGLDPLISSWPAFDQFTVVEPIAGFCDKTRAAAPAGADVVVLEGYLEEQVTALEARAPFDLIVASSLLHEVPDPRRLLASIRALAVADTVIHLNVPNVRSFHRLLALEMGQIEDIFSISEMEKRFERKTRFDRAKLYSLLNEEGFMVTRFETYFMKPFTHLQMEKIVDYKIVPNTMIDALDRMTKYAPELGCEMLVEAKKTAEPASPSPL